MSYELPQFVKNWLDELPADAKDRIIEAPRFFTGFSTYFGWQDGVECGCLVATASNMMPGCGLSNRHMTEEEAEECRRLEFPLYTSYYGDMLRNALRTTIGQWFPHAVSRDDYDTVVAAIKSYLAQSNPRIEVTVPETEAAVAV